jgi:hypothetical protein
MSSLLDLGPLTEEVEIRGVKLQVQGLSTASLFKLFAEFPDMTQMMADAGNAGSVMLSLAPDLIAKIIAIATGSPGDAAMEEKARTLGAADQMQILMAVQRLSFPQGFGPFVNQLTNLMGSEWTAATTLSEPSAESATNSHADSSGSLQTESVGMTRGLSPRAN